MKTGFLFLLQTIYFLASCVQIPRAIGAFYHVWKWHNVQWARSEMRRCTTHALDRSKLWQQDHCQHPQNANPDGSTHQTTLWRWWSRSLRLGTPQEDPDQGVHRKGPDNHWWDSPAVWWSSGGIRWPVAESDLAPAHKSKETQAWLHKECYDFVPFSHWPLPPPTWTHWTTSFGHTSRTSPTWPPTTPKPAWSPPSAKYSPSSRQRLWKRRAPSSGSVSRRWLRLKVATLKRCQLNYIIKLAELIFSKKF